MSVWTKHHRALLIGYRRDDPTRERMRTTLVMGRKRHTKQQRSPAIDWLDFLERGAPLSFDRPMFPRPMGTTRMQDALERRIQRTLKRAAKRKAAREKQNMARLGETLQRFLAAAKGISDGM